MQDLYFDITGQSLVWDAPEGRPDSVTSVTVWPVEYSDDGTAEAATTGSATVEANPDTTFDAASGYSQTDPTRLNLTATTGIEVGRRYLATNAAGESEWVEVVDIASGASVQSRHPLRNDYAASDTFESTRISISVDSTWVQDETNITDDPDPNGGYRIRWVYVIGSSTYVHDDYFNLVRYRAGHNVAPQDVEERYAEFLSNIPLEHQQDRGARLIDKAYKTLGFDLHRMGIPQEMLRNRDVVNELTELKTVMMIESDRAKKTGDSLGYEIARSEYQAALDGLVKAGNTDVAMDDGGGSSKMMPVSLWSK